MTKPLSGKEYAALQSLFAAMSHLQELLPILETRAKMLPNLWRDLKCVSALTSKSLDRILLTVPPEKLRHIMADIRNVQLYIRVEPPGMHSFSTEGFSYTPTKTLNSLLGYVCDHECMMCDKTPVESRKCEIRQMIDAALPHEVKAKDAEHCKYSDMVLGFDEVENVG